MRVLKGSFFAGLISCFVIVWGGSAWAQRLTFAPANAPSKIDSVLRYQSTGMQVLVTYQHNNNQPLPVDTFYVIVKNTFGVVGRYYMLKAAEKNQAASIIRIGDRGIYRIYVYNPKNRSLPVATGKLYITNDEFPNPVALLEEQRRLLISRGIIHETVAVNVKNKTPDNNVKTEKNTEPKPVEVVVKKTEPKKEEKTIIPVAETNKTPVEKPVTRKPDSEPTKAVVAKPINTDKLPNSNVDRNTTGNPTFGYTKTPIEKKADNTNQKTITEKKADNTNQKTITEKKADNTNQKTITEKKADNTKITNKLELDDDDTDSLLITDKLLKNDDDDDDNDENDDNKIDSTLAGKNPVATVKINTKNSNTTKTQSSKSNKSKKEDDFDDDFAPTENFDIDDNEFHTSDDNEIDDFDTEIDDE
jgi:hypothetical protein